MDYKILVKKRELPTPGYVVVEEEGRRDYRGYTHWLVVRQHYIDKKQSWRQVVEQVMRMTRDYDVTRCTVFYTAAAASASPLGELALQCKVRAQKKFYKKEGYYIEQVEERRQENGNVYWHSTSRADTDDLHTWEDVADSIVRYVTDDEVEQVQVCYQDDDAPDVF